MSNIKDEIRQKSLEILMSGPKRGFYLGYKRIEQIIGEHVRLEKIATLPFMFPFILGAWWEIISIVTDCKIGYLVPDKGECILFDGECTPEEVAEIEKLCGEHQNELWIHPGEHRQADRRESAV